ncbi:hypothetical protein CA13_63830 [Planctomycetes bacterium CA13]|uniref:Uncharacterized protein n=1 Tax=Novipirellula herctigrandis TaxID=2527986 RepID=A0A5C5ZC59_9BACT|nr:hypothetical protein CA13_63830 [Planctomycetes bacterium CA13]
MKLFCRERTRNGLVGEKRHPSTFPVGEERPLPRILALVDTRCSVFFNTWALQIQFADTLVIKLHYYCERHTPLLRASRTGTHSSPFPWIAQPAGPESIQQR